MRTKRNFVWLAGSNDPSPYFPDNMSKIEMLRLLINQRLTAAAEEIFRVFGKTIALYEEEISRSRQEIDRQRRLLDLSRAPQICIQAAAPGEKPTQKPSVKFSFWKR